MVGQEAAVHTATHLFILVHHVERNTRLPALGALQAPVEVPTAQAQPVVAVKASSTNSAGEVDKTKL